MFQRYIVSHEVSSFSRIGSMIPTPLSFGTPPQLQAWQPAQTAGTSFWHSENVHDHLRKLQETINLSKAVLNELEGILLIRSNSTDTRGDDLSADHHLARKLSPSSDNSIPSDASQFSPDDRLLQFFKTIKEKRISLDSQESLSKEAANNLYRHLKDQLSPLTAITSQEGPWEERSLAAKLAQKLQKSRRNKRWKKRKRKHVAELLCKERENHEKADQAADEWRAREIAKDIARQKVESMRAIAKLKANEEKKHLESELELVLVVEKLQELRSIRIQKLKKQGHFLPEEDDSFLDRVRAAVEEEEREVIAAADRDAAKDAIAIAEESRKAVHITSTDVNEINHNSGEASKQQDKLNLIESETSSKSSEKLEHEEQKVDRKGSGGGYDAVANLPFEFYHYYHGSNNDMGTLIEVRRRWDSYIRPRGSRIPGHWIQPPPPANEVWASYLVRPK
ncbi:U11/U12 small nuclear ribonucleoprotein 59 kDa protein [Typha angustifolia]|uniref:U11/U12 small nuclear ribonucleoprotein 59 kDa protein n=1 Tax=Typha angustifolia TaxID=59011 RepID=UPI003C2BDBD2